MLRPLVLVPFLLLPLAGCGHAAGAGPAAAPASTAALPAATPAVALAESTGSPSTAAKSATPAPLTGTQYAYLKSADPAKRTITFDLIEWFEGKAAVQACKDDGQPPAEDDWCTGWYIRNKNTKLRTSPVAKDAALRILGPDVTLTAADLKKFATTLGETKHVFVFHLANGVITKADEVYTP